MTQQTKQRNRTSSIWNENGANQSNLFQSINRLDSGVGNLVSFLQFAFIAAEGFLFTSNCGTKPMKIGYLTYVYMVAMFFVVQVFNNYAFDFNIPVPLHMIIRSVSVDRWQIDCTH